MNFSLVDPILHVVLSAHLASVNNGMPPTGMPTILNAHENTFSFKTNLVLNDQPTKTHYNKRKLLRK